MDVGSSFEIYGNLFGWYVNNQIVAFIVNTGLWILPFFLILYSAVWGNRGGGEGHNYNPVGTLINLEIQFYLGIFVVALFLAPVVSVDKTKFTYNNGVRVLTGGNTYSTFDTAMNNMPNTVKIPPAWYGILVITSGFNQVFKTVLPTGQQSRALTNSVKQLKIKDSNVAHRYSDFQNYCILPAAKRYKTLMAKHSDSNLARAIRTEFNTIEAGIDAKNQYTGDEYKVSPTSAGNVAYTTYNLYSNNINDICPASDPRGVAGSTLCIPVGIQSVPEPQLIQAKGTNLDCKTWWNSTTTNKTTGQGLNKLIYEDFNGQINAWDHITAGFKGIMINSPKLLHATLQRTQINGGIRTKGLNDKSGFAGAKQNIGEFLTAIGMSWDNFKNATFSNQVIRFGLPIAHGVIVMFFIIILPILVVFGRYQPQAVGTLVITYFGLIFLSGIWHFIAWMDNVLIAAFFGDQAWYNPSNMASLTRQLWDAFVMGAYVIFSLMWFFFVKELGGAASRGLANVLSAGAMAGAGGAATIAKASGAAGKRAGGHAYKAGSKFVGSRFGSKK